MCGIIGIVTPKLTVPHENFVQQALIADMLRGFDSTGMAALNEAGWQWSKKAVNGVDFIALKEDTPLQDCTLNKPAAIIGHNRAATKGKVNGANSHPFHHGDIIGVHNGTLRSYHNLDNTTFGTDSECLYHHLSKNGLVDTLENITGAWCLVWLNTKEDTLNIIRNDERPMSIAHLEGGGYAYASEMGMLKWLLNRNKIKVKEYFSLKEDVLMTVHKDTGIATFEKIEFTPMYDYWQKGSGYQGAQSGYSGYRYPSVQENLAKEGLKSNQNISVYLDYWDRYSTTSTIVDPYGIAKGYMLEPPFLMVEVQGVRQSEFKKDFCDVEVSSLQIATGTDKVATVMCRPIRNKGTTLPQAPVKEYKGPNGKATKGEMDKICKDGCGMCGDPIPESDYNELEYLEFGNETHPVCPSCKGDLQAWDVLPAAGNC